MNKNIEKNQVNTIAIGKFDGVHCGHKELFKKLGSNGAIFVIKKEKNTLTPKDKREEYLNYKFFKYNFSKIKNLSGKEFIEFLQKEFVNLEKIIVGYDFRFGHDRAWGTKELKQLFHGEVVIVCEFSIDGVPVHSAKIKEYLKDGNIKDANKLLGREYSFEGVVISGQGLGKKKLFPTINIKIIDFFIPKNGVYISKTKIKNYIYNSVIFVGNKESIDGSFSIETHLLDFVPIVENGDEIEIFFLDFIRENIKFNNLKDLKNQISKDIENAKNRLQSYEIN